MRASAPEVRFSRISGEFLCDHQHLSAFRLRKMGDFVRHLPKDVPQGLLIAKARRADR
jgi:hypothetical protein